MALRISPSAAGSNRIDWGTAAPILHNSSEFTIAVWVRHGPMQAADSVDRFFNQESGNSARVDLSIRTDADTRLGVIRTAYRVAGGNLFVNGITRIDDFQWHTVVYKRTATKPLIRLFVDGKPDNDSGTTDDPGVTSTEPTTEYWGNVAADNLSWKGDLHRGAFWHDKDIPPGEAEAFLRGTGRYRMPDMWHEMDGHGKGGASEIDRSGNGHTGVIGTGGIRPIDGPPILERRNLSQLIGLAPAVVVADDEDAGLFMPGQHQPVFEPPFGVAY